MKKLLRTLFLMIAVGLVVAAVASYMSKKRLESKSDDEIREFLARKLDGKVGEDQLATIQDAVIGGIRGRFASRDPAPSDEDAGATDDDGGTDDEAATSPEDAAEVEPSGEPDAEDESSGEPSAE